MTNRFHPDDVAAVRAAVIPNMLATVKILQAAASNLTKEGRKT